MTITIKTDRFFFWRRIAALEAEQSKLTLGLGKALADNEKQQKMLSALLIADNRKPAQPKKLRNQAEANAFIGESYDAPS